MKKDELYLENLDEFINDENRIVTYKWLSRTLQVHCNIAKQMLYKFLQNDRKQRDSLNVTYFVSGVTKPDENGLQVLKCSVVPEEKLDVCKKSLAHLTSCHVYSIQKCKLKDSNALFITDYEKFKENVFESNKYSSIQYDRAVLRSQEDLDLLTINTISTTESDKKPANGVSASTKPAGKKQQQSAIASMFSKADTSKQSAKGAESKTKEQAKPAESKAPAKGGKAKQGGMMANFFSKQPEKKTETTSKSEPKKDTKPVEKKISPKKEEDSPIGKSKKTARKHDSDDEEVQTKSKRRRIKPDILDSSSEEEDMEDEDAIPPTPPPREPTPEPETPTKEDSPEVEVVKAEKPKKTSPAKELDKLKKTSPAKESDKSKKTSPAKESATKGNTGDRKRKRVKRQTQKTYMDKDGFMVTEKVWETDSTDASESEEPVKKSAKEPAKPAVQTKGKKSPQKKPSPGKKGAASGKQTSLTSFFKKS